MIIGVVERPAIGLQRFHAEHSVVENPFHAIAIAAVSGDPQEIASEFEMRIAAARSFETAMGAGETVIKFVAFGAMKLSFGPQAPVAKLCLVVIMSNALLAARRCFWLPSARYACMAELRALQKLYA